MTLSITALCIESHYAEWRSAECRDLYADCRHAEYHYAECRYTECRDT
jgi:hypothetical protein